MFGGSHIVLVRNKIDGFLLSAKADGSPCFSLSTLSGTGALGRREKGKSNEVG